MSRNTLIGIAVVGVLVVIIAIFVQRSEREFQRQRRANQTSVSTSSKSPPAAAPSAGYGGFNSGGVVGSDGWTRTQLVGRWNDRPGCAEAIEFRANGTTNTGRWSYQSGRLSLIESTGTTVVEVVSIGDLEMVLSQIGSDRRNTWRRC